MSVFASIAVLASRCCGDRSKSQKWIFGGLTRTGYVLNKVFHGQVWLNSGAVAEHPRLLPKLRKLWLDRNIRGRCATIAEHADTMQLLRHHPSGSDHRPPLADFVPLQGAKSVGRALIRWRHLQPKVL